MAVLVCSSVHPSADARALISQIPCRISLTCCSVRSSVHHVCACPRWRFEAATAIGAGYVASTATASTARSATPSAAYYFCSKLNLLRLLRKGCYAMIGKGDFPELAPRNIQIPSETSTCISRHGRARPLTRSKRIDPGRKQTVQAHTLQIRKRDGAKDSM